MEVFLLKTAGWGKLAEVDVNGLALGVMDWVSQPGQPHWPGPMANVRFTYVTHAAFAWEEALTGNPAHKKQLQRTGDCSYVGYGQIVSVMPVEIDFGQLCMPDPNWSTNESLVGKFVRVTVDRLEMWPEPDASDAD